MQLKKNKRWLLSRAVGSLLGFQSGTSEAEWQVETAYRHYSEADRVTAMEPVLQLHKIDDEGHKIDFTIAYDTLSGASPNGAAVSEKPQTFTSTSGAGGSAESMTSTSGTAYKDDEENDDEYEGEGGYKTSEYTVQPGEVPLDPNFEDNRLSVSMNYSWPLNRTMTTSIGGSYSRETDYRSIGVNGGLNLFLNQKNTQVGFFLGMENDVITPGGGTSQAFSAMSNKQVTGSSETKNIIDGLISITQVLSKRAVMQLNYSMSISDGYHTDPYKIISLLDGQGDTQEYLYENRPTKRTKQSIYGALKYHVFGDTVDVSYRYMRDDWGVKSNTWDAKYRFNIGKAYVQPHLRHYSQEATDFYVNSLLSTDDLPQFASADYRLSALSSNTVGVKLGWMFDKNKEISFRVESYQQEGDSAAADLDALILQINYKVTF